MSRRTRSDHYNIFTGNEQANIINQSKNQSRQLFFTFQKPVNRCKSRLTRCNCPCLALRIDRSQNSSRAWTGTRCDLPLSSKQTSLVVIGRRRNAVIFYVNDVIAIVSFASSMLSQSGRNISRSRSCENRLNFNICSLTSGASICR